MTKVDQMINMILRLPESQISKHDKIRLCQCALCKNDPSTCGATEENEDEEGYCLLSTFECKFFNRKPLSTSFRENY